MAASHVMAHYGSPSPTLTLLGMGNPAKSQDTSTTGVLAMKFEQHYKWKIIFSEYL